MYHYVLIMFISTSSTPNSGAAAVSYRFESERACMSAGSALAENAKHRNNYVFTWGCFSSK